MPTNKFLIYLEDAERLYVQDGLETKAIEGILENKVSRRQLDNWKDIYNWDKKRENYKAKRNNLEEIMLDALNSSANRFLIDPSGKNNKEFRESIKTAKMLGIDLGVKVGGEEKKKAAPKDVAAAVRKLLKVK